MKMSNISGKTKVKQTNKNPQQENKTQRRNADSLSMLHYREEFI